MNRICAQELYRQRVILETFHPRLPLDKGLPMMLLDYFRYLNRSFPESCRMIVQCVAAKEETETIYSIVLTAGSLYEQCTLDLGEEPEVWVDVLGEAYRKLQGKVEQCFQRLSEIQSGSASVSNLTYLQKKPRNRFIQLLLWLKQPFRAGRR